MKRFCHYVAAYTGPLFIVTVSGTCGFVLGLAAHGST